jgi:hypothetical protein
MIGYHRLASDAAGIGIRLYIISARYQNVLVPVFFSFRYRANRMLDSPAIYKLAQRKVAQFGLHRSSEAAT